jgi:hypothetical protein
MLGSTGVPTLNGAAEEVSGPCSVAGRALADQSSDRPDAA